MSDYISTNYLSSSLQLSILKMQSAMTTAQTESTTGQYADLGLQLGAQSGQEISLQNENGLLQTYTSTNSMVATSLSTTQSALTTLQTDAQNALNALTEWTPQTYSGTSLQDTGASNMKSLVALSNSAVNGQYVFGGINSAVPPMTDYFAAPATAQTAIQGAFSTYLAGLSPPATAQTVTAAQMQTFLGSAAFTGLFTGAGWAANFSSASSTNVTADISPSESAQTTTNINQTGFQNLAEAYAMMNEFTGTGLNENAMQSVVTTASSLVSGAIESLTTTQATLGATQKRVTDANTDMAAQMNILQTQISNLDSVNAYQTATRVNALSTQIQTAYSLTAALQKLHLVNYL